MKAKTIKSVIRRKVDDWLASIEDEEVRKLAAKNTIVTGGCIASMLLKEKVNDFDIYFRDFETTEAVVNYYAKRFQPKNKNGIHCSIVVKVDHPTDYMKTATKEELDEAAKLPKRIRTVIRSAGIASEGGTTKAYEYFESSAEGAAGDYIADVLDDPGEIQDQYEAMETAAQNTNNEDVGEKYRPVFVSTNAITLSSRVQIVNRFYGEPEEIHENYDFVHCTNYWTSWGGSGDNGELVLKADAMEALLTKELRYVGSKYPICSLIRLRKFIGRGWTVNAGQILKMVFQIQELDLNKIHVLQDQLTGVDAAYFSEMLSKIKDDDPEKINSAYLIEVVDRMF